MIPYVSIVIATRDRAGMLADALASLAAQRDAPPFETIVVDNGSSDATGDLARAADGAGVGLRYAFVAEPNRAKARNAGIALATGALLLFVDDDVVLAPGFLAAHAAAHRAARVATAVSGPIVNVATRDARPRPALANYSGAFFCTCNVSVPRERVLAVGGFDERFDRYGWEDTELGLRLRASGVRRAFAWGAYLHHIKLPRVETLDTVLAKTTERAQMAARLLRKNPGMRTRLATGAYALNLWRSTLLAPAWSLDGYRSLATSERVPAPLRAIARGQYLDGAYRTTLRRALAGARDAASAAT